MKKYIAGLISGILIAFMLTLTAYAAMELIVKPNEYPIIINGQNSDIEGYNINGFTYLKVADVAAALGGTSIFNEVKKQIEINSNMASVKASQAAPGQVYNIGDTATTDKYEITILSLKYIDCPPSEIDGKAWYFDNPEIRIALVNFKIKNIADHDVKITTPLIYEDKYREKSFKGLPNTLIHYAPNYCNKNSIGYTNEAGNYLKSNEEKTILIDYPVPRSIPIGSIVINDIIYIP